MKMVTVIGIIGKTHGVTSEIRPHVAAVTRKASRPVFGPVPSTRSDNSIVLATLSSSAAYWSGGIEGFRFEVVLGSVPGGAGAGGGGAGLVSGAGLRAF